MKISHIILRLRLIWQHICTKLRRNKHQPVESLDQNILAAVRKEAEFLKGQHGVQVRSLEAGETPDVPKPAKKSPY